MNNDTPIAQRLETLQSQWQSFLEKPDAVVFRWLLCADETDMFDGFVETENQNVGSTETIFIPLADEFANGSVHGFRLGRSLGEFFQEAEQPEDPTGKFPDPWVCPARTKEDLPDPYLVRCIESFCDHYRDYLTHLALVLRPGILSSPALYVDWVSKFLALPLPPSVRLVVIDSAEHPVYGTLAEKSPSGKVHTETAHLEMDQAYEEMAAEDDGPGAEFRRHYVTMVNRIGKHDMPQADEHGEAALAAAREEDNPQLETVVHIGLGSGYLGAQDPKTSLVRYRLAKESADRSISKNDPGAKKIKAQCLFGECGALIALKRLDEAAPLYTEAALLSRESDDAPLALEGHRMAAYCHLHESRWEDAWRESDASISLAEAMDRSEVPKTTARFAAREFHRLSRKWRYSREQREELDARLEKLLGPDWRSELEKEVAL